MVIAAYQKQLCLIGNLYLRDQAQGCSILSFCFCFYFKHILFAIVCSVILAMATYCNYNSLLQGIYIIDCTHTIRCLAP